MNKFLISLVIFTTLSTQIFANPKLQARTGILVDYHSDEILFELDPDSQIYPASMTKIMTSIIAFELIEKGDLSLDDKFMVSENAWRLSQSGYSSMFIMVNDEVSVEDLLKGIIIASGNDACVALAEGIAGTEEEFAVLMTTKAKEVGIGVVSIRNSGHLGAAGYHAMIAAEKDMIGWCMTGGGNAMIPTFTLVTAKSGAAFFNSLSIMLNVAANDYFEIYTHHGLSRIDSIDFDSKQKILPPGINFYEGDKKTKMGC